MALLAVLLHAMLFFAAQPKRIVDKPNIGTPPVTLYMSQRSGTPGLSGTEVRVVNTPVIFSLPSEMGFSRELGLHEVSTRLNTFSLPKSSEEFLAVEDVSLGVRGRFSSKEFMVWPGSAMKPDVPNGGGEGERRKLSARRVTMSPELKERLIGGIVLPAVLNQPVSKSWEAKASVRISAEGVVEHIFFDEPIEPQELSIQLLRLLHSLNFKTGEPVEGRIEIYSPEPEAKTEGSL
jgi:hypothetical protein